MYWCFHQIWQFFGCYFFRYFYVSFSVSPLPLEPQLDVFKCLVFPTALWGFAQFFFNIYIFFFSLFLRSTFLFYLQVYWFLYLAFYNLLFTFQGIYISVLESQFSYCLQFSFHYCDFPSMNLLCPPFSLNCSIVKIVIFKTTCLQILTFDSLGSLFQVTIFFFLLLISV